MQAGKGSSPGICWNKDLFNIRICEDNSGIKFLCLQILVSLLENVNGGIYFLFVIQNDFSMKGETMKATGAKVILMLG